MLLRETSLDLHTVATSDVAENIYLRNKTKTLLCEACVAHSATAKNCNQRMVKTKEVDIAMGNLSMEERHADLGWSGDESDDDTVDNASETTSLKDRE